MKKYAFETPTTDSNYLNPKIYGQLAKLFCAYDMFWPCKRLISDYIEGSGELIPEQRQNENVIHYFADLFVMISKSANHTIPGGLEWLIANKNVEDIYNRTEIVEERVCPYNVMQLLQHIAFIYLQFSRENGTTPPTEPVEMKFLRTELFSSLCLAVLNHLVPQYIEAPCDILLGTVTK